MELLSDLSASLIMNQGLVPLAGFCSKQLKLYFYFLDKSTVNKNFVKKKRERIFHLKY